MNAQEKGNKHLGLPVAQAWGPTNDGQIDETRSNLTDIDKWLQTQDNAMERSLEEVEGLFAAHTYLEKTEPLSDIGEGYQSCLEQEVTLPVQILSNSEFCSSQELHDPRLESVPLWTESLCTIESNLDHLDPQSHIKEPREILHSFVSSSQLITALKPTSGGQYISCMHCYNPCISPNIHGIVEHMAGCASLYRYLGCYLPDFRLAEASKGAFMDDLFASFREDVIHLVISCASMREISLADSFHAFLERTSASSSCGKVMCLHIDSKNGLFERCTQEINNSASELAKHFLTHVRTDEARLAVGLPQHLKRHIPDFQSYRSWLHEPNIKQQLRRLNQTRCLHQTVIEGPTRLQSEVETLKRECHGHLAFMEDTEDMSAILQRLQDRFCDEEHTPEFLRYVTSEYHSLKTLWQSRLNEISSTIKCAESRNVKLAVQRLLESRDTPSTERPNSEQWNSIRSLRTASNELHRRMMAVVANEISIRPDPQNLSTLRILRQQSKSSSAFLSTGILTFRNILRGQAPSTLKEVLAFICLSTIVSHALRSKGISVDETKFWSDFSKWRDAISNDEERFEFSKIAIGIWPECSDALKGNPIDESVNETHFDTMGCWSVPGGLFPDLSTGTPDPLLQELESFNFTNSRTSLLGYDGVRQNRAGSTSRDFQFPRHLVHDSPSSTDEHIAWFLDPVKSLLEQTQASEMFSFADFRNVDATSETRQDSSTKTLTPAYFPNGNHSRPVEGQDFSPSAFRPPDPPDIGFIPLGTESQNACDPVLMDPPLSVILLLSLVFQVVVTFLHYIGSLGDLLQQLASIRRPSQDAFFTMTSDELLPVTIKVLDPLELSDSLMEQKPVLGTAIEMVAAGFFACVHHVKEYVLRIGRFFSTSTSSYQALVEKLSRLFTEAKTKTIFFCDCESGNGDFYNTYNIDAGVFENVWTSQQNSPDSMAPWKQTTLQQTNLIRSNSEQSSIGQPLVSGQSDGSWSHEENLLTRSSTSTTDSFSLNHSSSFDQRSGFDHSPSMDDKRPTPIFSCHYDGCGKPFKGHDGKSNLRRHVREHHERKKVSCPYDGCGSNFKRAEGLRDHWSRRHSHRQMPDWVQSRRKTRR